MQLFLKLLLGFGLMCSGPAKAQSLWQSAAVDMSPAQVQGLFIDARFVDVADRAEPLAPGVQELLRVPMASWHSQSWRASFYFLNDRLQAVVLRSSDRLDVGEADHRFDLIANPLRQLHGNGAGWQTDAMGMFAKRSIWLLEASMLRLEMVGVAGKGAQLTMFFGSRSALWRDRL
jgi:hypothetical protein